MPVLCHPPSTDRIVPSRLAKGAGDLVWTKRLQRDEEGESAFFCEAFLLLLHLVRFPGSRLCQQDDPGVLQQFRPADVRAEFRSAPREERLDILKLRVRKLVESPLKIDEFGHAFLDVNIDGNPCCVN